MGQSGNVRRGKKRHALPGSHTKQEWLDLKKAYGKACAYCGATDVKLTKDHIIPVSRPDLGATNYIWNIIPCCEECNTKKGDSIYRANVLM